MNTDEKSDEKMDIEEKFAKCQKEIEILKIQIRQRRMHNSIQILEETKESDNILSQTNHLYNAYRSYDISYGSSYDETSAHLPQFANDPSAFNSVKSMSTDSNCTPTGLIINKAVKKVPGNDNGIYKRIIDENDETLKNIKNRDIPQMKYDLDNKPNINIKKQLLFGIDESFTGHIGKIYTFDIAPNDEEILSCGQDGLLIVWDIDTKTKRIVVKLETEYITTSAYCTYNKSKQIFACGGLSKVCYVYDLTNMSGLYKNGKEQLIASFAGHGAYISCIKFIDENRLITSSGDSTCILWDIEQNKSVQIFENSLYSKSDITSIDIVNNNVNSNMFISGSVDGYIRLYDIRKNEKRGYIAKFGDDKCQINSVKCFKNGTSFVSGYEDGHVRFYDLRSYNQLNYYVMDNGITDVNGICCIDFSKSGSFMFNVFEYKECSDGYENKINNCVVRHTITGKKMSNLCCESPIAWLKVASNGKFIVTSHLNKTVKIWKSYMQSDNNACGCF